MAAVTHAVGTQTTTDASSYASGSFTPAAGDLLVVFVGASDTVAAGSMTDSQGLGFTKVASALSQTSTDTLYCFVANALAAASAMTVTFDCTGDAATGTIIVIARVSGMTRLGSAAVLQSAVQENQAEATPAPSFAVAALTGNPTLGAVVNNSNPAGMTPPTGWLERSDSGLNTPTRGLEYVTRDSGFTGTTITWGNASATAFGALIIEMDTTSGFEWDRVVSQTFPYERQQVLYGPRWMMGAGDPPADWLFLTSPPGLGGASIPPFLIRRR